MFYVALAQVKHYFGQGPGSNTNHLKRAGTTRATSSIIKSGQKDTEASIIVS